ncbi:MAG: cupin domain-containing protein [candidate division Zixibacteria bacterium]|nr:cupin domain-containing protein [candidate division Zixibacteria bacterium]
MSELNKKDSGRLEPSRIYRLESLLDYVPGSIVSRTLVKNQAGTVTLFTFDAGQALSEHLAPYDAMVQVLDGQAELTIGGKPVTVHTGETIIMPANIPHAVHSEQRSKILLIMIRE